MVLKQHLLWLFACLILVTCLTACSSVKKTVGLERRAPDEFSVLKRAPLSVPPEFSLRAPEPGANRPQENSVTQDAATAVLDSPTTALQDLSTGEKALLDMAKTSDADSNIRQRLAIEPAPAFEDDRPTYQRLIYGPENNGKAINPAEEAKALGDAYTGPALNETNAATPAQ